MLQVKRDGIAVEDARHPQDCHQDLVPEQFRLLQVLPDVAFLERFWCFVSFVSIFVKEAILLVFSVLITGALIIVLDSEV